MSKAKLPKLYRRRWINRNEGSAYIIIDAGVEKCDWGTYKDGTTLYATIEIKDCNRQSKLEFWAYNQKEYKQRMTKIRDIIEALEDLEGFMRDNPPAKAVKAPVEAPSEPEELYEDELLLTDKVEEPVNVIPATAVLRPVRIKAKDETK